VALATLTLVAEYGLRVAVAAWNSGRPGAGMAYLRRAPGFLLRDGVVNPKRNWCSVRATRA